MKPEIIANNQDFLSGGGEMGALIQEYNWSETPVGDIKDWEQSLCTTVGILLHSAFPIFLFWGKDLTCFYNDALRPSLGIDGKHPAIGKSGKEVWPEIWEFIGSLIEQVMTTNKPVWFEDQLVPFYRNGRIEDIYWTFSYSPAYGDNGQVNGVFVTCTETTGKVVNFKKLEESERRLRLMMRQAPVAISIFRSREYIVEIVNPRALELWGRKEEEVINQPILEAMPELQAQGIKEMLDGVYNTGQPFEANELPVQIKRGTDLATVYVNFVYEALYDADETINGIMAVGFDVTEQVAARKKVEENESKLNVVIDAGELGIFEMDFAKDEVVYSKRSLEIFGYRNVTSVSSPHLRKHVHPDDLPVRDQAMLRALKESVLHFEARLIWNDKSIHWIESKGRVFYDAENKPVKLIGTIRDITEAKHHQKDLQESEQKFRLLADSMPQHIWTAGADGNSTTLTSRSMIIPASRPDKLIQMAGYK